MKRLILCLILLSYPAAAAIGSPYDIGADMVKNGFVAFIRAMGDESFAAAGVNGTTSSINSYVALSTYTFDPFSFKKVQDLNIISGMIAFLFMLLYIFAGLGWTALCRISPGIAIDIAEITDLDRNIAGKQYIKNIAVSMLALIFGHVVIRIILISNYVLSSLVVNYTEISTIDSSSNFMLYFFSGLVFLVNIIFYAWRLVVICAVASFSLVIGAMWIWGYTQKIAIEIIKYFVAVTYLQLIVIAIIAAGMIAVDVVNGFVIAPISSATNLPSLILIAVLIMSVAISIMICLKPILSPVINIVVRRVI